MKPLSSFSKVLIGFFAGAIVAGSVAVAVTPDTPPTKVCVDKRLKRFMHQLMEVVQEPEP